MAADPQQMASRRARIAAGLPYLWLAVFFLVPFVIVLKISLSQPTIAQPPYLPLLDPSAGWEGLKQFIAGLSLDAYGLLGSDPIYLWSYLKSLQVAAVSTAILLLIGYPIAYGIARSSCRLQPALVMLVILPFWTSFLIRVYAWINILQRDGLLNDVLIALRIIDSPGGVAVVRHRDLYRHGLFLSAVHGAAALCRAGEDGRDADRSGGRSRLHAAWPRSGG